MSQETPQGKREQAEVAFAVHPDMEVRSLLTAVEGGTVYHGIQGLREWAQDKAAGISEESLAGDD